MNCQQFVVWKSIIDEKKFFFILFYFWLMSVWLIVLLDKKLSFCCKRCWLSSSLFHYSQDQYQDRTFIHNNLSTTWTTKNLKNALIDKIFIKYERFVFFTINRDFLFIFNFWSILWYHFWIQLRYNIVYHSQTNKHTKKQN